MKEDVIESRKPEGTTKLEVHCGSPAADTVFPFPQVVVARVYGDGTLVALNDAGKIVILLSPGSYWGYLWT